MIAFLLTQIAKLKAAISSADSDIAKFKGNTSYTATAGEKFTINSQYIQKIGSYVFGCIVATSTDAFGTSDEIATLPSDIKPSAIQRPLYIEIPGDPGVWCGSTAGSVNTDGTIKQAVSGSFSSGVKLKIEFAYSLI